MMENLVIDIDTFEIVEDLEETIQESSSDSTTQSDLQHTQISYQISLPLLGTTSLIQFPKRPSLLGYWIRGSDLSPPKKTGG